MKSKGSKMSNIKLSPLRFSIVVGKQFMNRSAVEITKEKYRNDF
jgi:hypothetical protein